MLVLLVWGLLALFIFIEDAIYLWQNPEDTPAGELRNHLRPVSQDHLQHRAKNHIIKPSLLFDYLDTQAHWFQNIFNESLWGQ